MWLQTHKNKIIIMFYFQKKKCMSQIHSLETVLVNIFLSNVQIKRTIS